MPAVRHPNVPKLAYNLAEAQLATGQKRGTLLGAISRGELEARAVGPSGPGRAFLIPAEALERWVAGNEVPADPEPVSAAGDSEPEAATVVDPAALSRIEPVPDGSSSTAQ